MSTEEFSRVRNNSNYKIREDSFEDFRNHENFLSDTLYAINKKNFGPSFYKFKESLINASPFSIITARGNSPDTIRQGVKIIVDSTFTDS